MVDPNSGEVTLGEKRVAQMRGLRSFRVVADASAWPKSRRDAMFIEKVSTTNPASPFMGERYSVSLLKELPDLNSVWCSINISPLRGFYGSLLK